MADHPFYLMLVDHEGERDEQGVPPNVQINLDEPGWLTTYSDWLRRPCVWHLVRKDNHVIVGMVAVHEGEQPYFVARHVGFTGVGGGAQTETVTYGIGKKRLDGSTDRLWFLSNGTVTVGDDVEEIALDLLKRGFL